MAVVPITSHGRNITRIYVMTLGDNSAPADQMSYQGGCYRWFLRREVHDWFVEMNIPYQLTLGPDPKKPDRHIFHVEVADNHEVIVRLRWVGNA